MNVFRLLFVEDDEQDIATCRDAVLRYKDEKQRDVDLVECKNIEEAFSKLDNSIDGAIIDLKLGDQGDEGNEVLKRIEESHFRILVFILTGTPDNTYRDLPHIEIFKKGDPGSRYADLLDRFWGIYDTGLTRIMGGRGQIENNLINIFHYHLIPQIDIWIKYGKTDSPRTEKALLRHALNHLLQLLDDDENRRYHDDENRRYPEEVYLVPPLTNEIRTGSLVEKKDNGIWFAVMSPACDLVVRVNGSRNTDRILIMEVDPAKTLFPWFKDETLSNSQKSKLKEAFKNNKSTYYHWLPTTKFFKGGFLNFRKLETLDIEKFNERFKTPPKIQISPSFVKDIVARFSSYYARQGQPDIDFDKFINRRKMQTTNSN